MIFGRFVMGVRAFLPPLAGSAGMPFVQFLLLDAVGAVVRAGLFVTLGYTLGWGPERIHQGYRGVSIALLAAVGIGLVVYLALKVARRRRHGVASVHAYAISRTGRPLHLNLAHRKESHPCVHTSDGRSSVASQARS